MTAKDRVDLEAAVETGVDWIALSFVQRAQEVVQVKEIVAGRALVLAKIEKPQAIVHLDEIMLAADGLMVARGDLGVEMPLEKVPGLQKRITREARRHGRPVIVATQMLEFDDFRAGADPRRSFGCRHGGFRGRRRHHALGGKRVRRLSDPGGGDDESHRGRDRA